MSQETPCEPAPKTEPPMLLGEVWRGGIPISTDDGEEMLLAAVVLREADGRPYAHLLHDGRWHTLDEESAGVVFAAWALAMQARAERAEAETRSATHALTVELGAALQRAERTEALAATERAYRVEPQALITRIGSLRARGCDGAADKLEEEYAPLCDRLRAALVGAGGVP